MAIYDNKGNHVNWREQDIYGSSRLGTWEPNVNLDNNNAATVWDTVGHKSYELSNHLGNVLATITDRRLPHTTDGTTIDYYQPEVTMSQEYFAFGAQIPKRNYFLNNQTYRYGFNGKENDNEVKLDADGNPINGAEQDYGMRIYDPRVGRFFSTDPIAAEIPGLTPYQFGGNSPIAFIDLDGLEPAHPKRQKDFMAYFIKGIRGGISEQSDEAQAALFQILSNPETYHKLDEIAEQAMRNPFKLARMLDESASKTAKRMAVDAVVDAAGVARAFIQNKNKGAYEAGKFVSKYGLFLIAPEEEGMVTSVEQNEIRSLAEAKTTVKEIETIAGSSIRPIKTRPVGMSDMNWGNELHYDQLNGGTGVGLPSQLQALYPKTTFQFTGRGVKGADVEVTGG